MMGNDGYSPPRSPVGLAAPGRRLWRLLCEAFQFRDDEAAILEQACRLRDEIGTLEAALAGAPAVVEGSRGQIRAHPLFAEIRAHRLALSRLLGQLGLNDADAPDASERRSHAGRRLARQRWG